MSVTHECERYCALASSSLQWVKEVEQPARPASLRPMRCPGRLLRIFRAWMPRPMGRLRRIGTHLPSGPPAVPKVDIDPRIKDNLATRLLPIVFRHPPLLMHSTLIYPHSGTRPEAPGNPEQAETLRGRNELSATYACNTENKSARSSTWQLMHFFLTPTQGTNDA